MFKPRLNQIEILEYESGKMGISAVPGSGKTRTLSALAAKLILRGKIDNEQEILIVTLVNSAVDNFSSRIAGFVKEAGLLENVGYRVRTLHGLAHDIVRERPDLVGVSNQFSIIDETESFRMIDQISTEYSRVHPEVEDFLMKPDVDRSKAHHSKNGWNSLITSLNQSFINQAKDLDIEPDEIQLKMKKHQYKDLLLEMAVDVYAQYQRGLKYRNALDFADLIRLAYRALTADPQYLERLRYRWPYILEDEAQDSSRTQEQILRLLTGPEGNWVRVGDPNQAIYETFTTANPKYLRSFLKEPGVTARSLPHSGRSSRGIINLANSLVIWARENHPVPDLRSALDLPLIQPTPPGDPQPNPPDLPNSIYIKYTKSTADEEIRSVVSSIKRFLEKEENQQKTIAVLCPIGLHGEKVAQALQNAGIEIVEMLKSTQTTRTTARVLEKILLYLANPSDPKQFAQAFSTYKNSLEHNDEEKQLLQSLTSAIRRCRNLEDFFYPAFGSTWQSCIESSLQSDLITKLLGDFREKCIRWHQATILPIDQLVLTITNDLFTNPADLALGHKLALLLEFSANLHPEYELTDFAMELSDISGNARKFSGFSDEDTRFDPDLHKGKVFVSTFHKAKGLEWDRVYLLSVNNYDFPSAQPEDKYVGEKWFIRENFDPQAEVLSKLEALFKDDISLLFLPAGEATLKARLDYSAERLRLLFVGITRARESLMISWNTGKGDCRIALSLESLYQIWKGKNETA